MGFKPLRNSGSAGGITTVYVEIPGDCTDEVLYSGDVISRLEFHLPLYVIEDALTLTNLDDVHPVATDENFIIATAVSEVVHPLSTEDETAEVIGVDDTTQNSGTDDQTVTLSQDEIHQFMVDGNTVFVSQDEIQDFPLEDATLTAHINIEEIIPTPVDTNSITGSVVLENQDKPLESETEVSIVLKAGSNAATQSGDWDNPTNAEGLSDSSNASMSSQLLSASSGTLTLNYYNWNTDPLDITLVTLEAFWGISTTISVGTNTLDIEYRYGSGDSWKTLASGSLALVGSTGGPTLLDVTTEVGGDWQKLRDLEVRCVGNAAAGGVGNTITVDAVELCVEASTTGSGEVAKLFTYQDDSSGNEYHLSELGTTMDVPAPIGSEKFISGRGLPVTSGEGFIRENVGDFNILGDLSISFVFELHTLPTGAQVKYICKYGNNTGSSTPFSIYVDGTDGLVFRYGLNGASTQTVFLLPSPVINTVYTVSILREVVDGVSITTNASVNGTPITPHVFSGTNSVLGNPDAPLVVMMNNNAPTYSNSLTGQMYDLRIWDYAKPIEELERIVENVGNDIPRGTELACYRFRDIEAGQEHTKEYFDFSGHDIDIIERPEEPPTPVSVPVGYEKWVSGYEWIDATYQQLYRETDRLNLTGDMAFSCVFTLNTLTANGSDDHLARYGNTADRLTGCWSVHVNGGATTNTVEVSFGTSGSGLSIESGVITAGNTYKFAFVREGNSVTISLDSVRTSDTFTGTINDNSGGEISIGANNNNAGAGRYNIYDVRVWDYAKPLDAIESLLDENYGDDEPIGDETACYRFWNADYPNPYKANVTKVAGDGGTTGYLQSSGIWDSADSTFVNLSVWIKPTTDEFYIFYNGGDDFIIRTDVNRAIVVYGENNSSNHVIDIVSDNNAIVLNEWNHILLSFSIGASTGSIYVNNKPIGISSSDYPIRPVNNINYSDNIFRACGSTNNAINGEVTHLWFDRSSYIDFTDENNRQKFFKNGSPRFLGNNGELPTGSIPDVFLREAGENLKTNYGIRSSFTWTTMTRSDETENEFPQFCGK